MRQFISTLVSILAVNVLVQAQSNFTTCCSITPSSVDQATRVSWCRAQQNTCPLICANGQTSSNACDPTTFTYDCTCLTGPTGNISDFAQTLPSLECDSWKSQCTAAHPNDLVGQTFCRSFTCGSRDASLLFSASSSSSSISATVSSAASSTSALPSSLTTSVSSTKSTSATSPTSHASSVPNAIGASSNSGKLSTGAKVGIAVGVILGIAALMALAWLLWRRRNKKHHLNGPNNDLPELKTNEKSAYQTSARQMHGDNGRDLPTLETVEQYPKPMLADVVTNPSGPYSGAIAPRMNGAERVRAVASTPTNHHEADSQEIYEAPGPSSVTFASNPDLDRMRQELAEIQVHKSRLEQLHALSAREAELRNAISDEEKRVKSFGNIVSELPDNVILLK